MFKASAKPLKYSIEDLIDTIGKEEDIRVVLLGESSHGTHEFYETRAEITKRLIKYHGFTIVACEADWPAMEIVDSYSRRNKSGKKLFSGFERFPSWMWKNQEFLEFVEWSKSYNQDKIEPENKVKLTGLDLYSLFESFEAVIGYLDSVDPNAANLAKKYFSCFEPFNHDPQAYAMETAFGLARSCKTEVIKLLQMMIERREEFIKKQAFEETDEYIKRELQFKAEINALITKDAEAYYTSMMQGGRTSWNNRDKHMMHVLKLLLQFYRQSDPLHRPTKVVVWAHNSHIGDARYTDMGGKRGQLNLGQLCREEFGLECFNIGQLTYKGTVTCASDWDSHTLTKSVNHGSEDSFEYQLHQNELSHCLVKFRDTDARKQFEDYELRERYIGVIYHPETELQSHYSTTNIALEYDAIIFHDETSALKAL